MLLHVPCHLQFLNAGDQTRETLKLIPGARIVTTDKCCGHGLNWGIKKEYRELSLKVGGRLFRTIRESQGMPVISNCSRARNQIRQGTKSRVFHPIEILADAYGIS